MRAPLRTRTYVYLTLKAFSKGILSDITPGYGTTSVETRTAFKVYLINEHNAKFAHDVHMFLSSWYTYYSLEVDNDVALFVGRYRRRFFIAIDSFSPFSLEDCPRRKEDASSFSKNKCKLLTIALLLLNEIEI